MAYERVQAGANSATFFVTGPSVVIPASEWALLPEGKLKSVMNRSYEVGGGIDYPLFLRTFAAAGGRMTITSCFGIENYAYFFGDSTVFKPTIEIQSATEFATVQISVSYSASE